MSVKAARRSRSAESARDGASAQGEFGGWSEPRQGAARGRGGPGAAGLGSRAVPLERRRPPCTRRLLRRASPVGAGVRASRQVVGSCGLSGGGVHGPPMARSAEATVVPAVAAWRCQGLAAPGREGDSAQVRESEWAAWREARGMRGWAGERAWTRGAWSAPEGECTERGLGCAPRLEGPQVRGPGGQGALDRARNGASACGLFCA